MTETRGSRFAVAVGLLSVLAAACATGGTKVTRVDYDYSGNPREFLTYLASRGPDLRTVVLSPEGTDAEATGRVVTAAMNARRVGAQVNYTTAPTSEASPHYRVVMALGTEPILGRRLCRTTDAGEVIAMTRDLAAIQAAFCYRDRSLSEAYVEVASLAGANDPNLPLAIDALMVRLFPLQVPPDIGNNCPLGAFC
ncbi:MAG: hypothetical protein EXQ94_05815 [Alphaproteobacteria bacterium]|nr:hypothetical protein [Alphaproteobacteria bacterium]